MVNDPVDPMMWVICYDAVQTHVTKPMLIWLKLNDHYLGLRCPLTSHATQNEDLITFWIFRNDSLFGFNKMKQQELLKVLTHEGRTSLNYSDAMSCVRPGWEVAHNKQPRDCMEARWFAPFYAPSSDSHGVARR